MKTQKLDSFLKRIPSVVLAIFTLIVATIVMSVVGEIMHFDRVSYLAYSLNGLIIAGGSFYIIKNKPKSFWYVLPITNAITIISAFIEPTFWRGLMWIPICGGWVVTIIAVIVAVRIGIKETSEI